MSSDEKLMELIEEDLLSVSEFGDRYYYEGIRELEREEEEKQRRFQNRVSSTSRRNRNRGHVSYINFFISSKSQNEKGFILCARVVTCTMIMNKILKLESQFYARPTVF